MKANGEMPQLGVRLRSPPNWALSGVEGPPAKNLFMRRKTPATFGLLAYPLTGAPGANLLNYHPFLKNMVICNALI
jgi:hypothetical protein